MLLTILCYLWLTWSVICVYLFHVAWWGTEKARRAEREIKGQWPLFEHPNLLKWNYWTMLLQSFTTMPVRLFLNLLSWFIIGNLVLCLGEVHDNSTWKRTINTYLLWVGPFFNMTTIGFTFEEIEPEFDYSKWLGPNWKRELEEFKRDKTVATFVANHTAGLLDVLVFLSNQKGYVSFVAAAFLRNTLWLSRCISSGDGIFVSRAASEADKQNLVDTIAERQINITNRRSARKPICIFAEGFSTVGGISKFKRGAFNSLMPVVPVVLIQKPSTVYVGSYSAPQHLTMLASMCTLGMGTYKVHKMPPFVPNDYLFNTYNKRVDAPKWEVFADAVREAMLEYSGLTPSDMTYNKSREYIKLIQGDLKKSWTDKKEQ